MADKEKKTWYRDPNRNYQWTAGVTVKFTDDELENGPPAFTPDELEETSSLPRIKETREVDDNGNMVREKKSK